MHESIAFSRFGLLLNRKQIPRFVETYVVSESGEMIVRARGRAPYTVSAASTCVYIRTDHLVRTQTVGLGF